MTRPHGATFVTVKPGNVADWQGLQLQSKNVTDADVRKTKVNLVGFSTLGADFVQGGWSQAAGLDQPPSNHAE